MPIIPDAIIPDAIGTRCRPLAMVRATGAQSAGRSDARTMSVL